MAWMQRLTRLASAQFAKQVDGQRQSGQVAVYVSGSVVATAHANFDTGLEISLRADPIGGLTEISECLKSQAKSLGLARQPLAQHCNLVLAPELYTMSLVERPDVAQEELADAVRWLIQDQVDYPVEEASLDVFELPASASRDRRMVFAVSTQTQFLSSLVAQVYAAGFELDSIDIAELALRNLAWQCYPLPDQSVGLLRLTAHSGIINVSRGDELYLARRLSGVPEAFAEPTWEDFRERLLLQVQRSIDYYESAMNQPPCNMLMVACTDSWSDRVVGYLGSMLPIPVRTIADALEGEMRINLCNPESEVLQLSKLTEKQTNALAAGLPVLGGVLRQRVFAQFQLAA